MLSSSLICFVLSSNLFRFKVESVESVARAAYLSLVQEDDNGLGNHRCGRPLEADFGAKLVTHDCFLSTCLMLFNTSGLSSRRFLLSIWACLVA